MWSSLCCFLAVGTSCPCNPGEQGELECAPCWASVGVGTKAPQTANEQADMQRWGGGTAPAQKTATTSGPGSPVLCGDCPCESGGARRSVGVAGVGGPAHPRTIHLSLTP